MRIRRLGVGDEAALREALTVFRGYERVEPETFLSDPNGFVMIADTGNNIIGWTYGYILSRPEGQHSMLIYELEVETDHRRRGVASQLISSCIDLATESGCRKAWVMTDRDNTPALNLYAKTNARRGQDQAILIWDQLDTRREQ